MSSKIRELREQRAKLVADGRAMLDKANDEKRNLTDEEQTAYDEIIEKQDGLRQKIEAEERQTELDREIASRAGQAAEDRGGDVNEAEQRAKAEIEGYRSFLQHGVRNAALEGVQQRALQADVDIQGGYLVAPERIVQMLIKFIDDQVFMRGLATVFPVPNAESLGAPSLDNDPADADWTTELATGSEDSTMSFGKRSLHPHPLAKRIKVSNTLLRKSMIPAEQLVMSRLSYKFAITQEKAFLTGNGSGQPLGVFTASADGVPTSRDVSTDNTTTAVTMDGLINAKYNLKGQYWPRAKWLFHRDALKQISKLKDGMGQYLWRPSVREGEPDILLSAPVMMSEYVPNTFTTGLYVGMFADFSHYWIADSMAMQIQRLVELYAETNQTGFIGRLESDGMPTLAEAFSRVKLA